MVHTENLVLSADGTTISYRTTGAGPGLILVPGALALAADFDALARALGDTFMVHTIERRGRGHSGPQGNAYSVERECEDIRAVQQATNAPYIFGHSFGGLLVLEAARNNAALRKLAVYEPGVSIDGSISVSWISECRDQLMRERYLDAFITFIRGINPDTSGKAPRFMLKLILPLAIRKTERQQKYRLLHTTIPEHAEARRLDNTYENYRQITADILLLSGKPAGVSALATAKLAAALKPAKAKVFPEMDHFGPEKHPAVVAEQLKRFIQP